MMGTTAMNFDPTLHGTAVGAGTAGTAQAGLTGVAAGQGGLPTKPAEPSELVEFEGFLKKAGHVAGVVLTEIIRYAVPIAQMAAVVVPSAAPAAAAFTTSVRLVQTAVVSAQQRWASEGSAANTQKLADVLETVEQPVTLLFAQAGLQVDRAYVINLINGVVAILNAQPGLVLQAPRPAGV